MIEVETRSFDRAEWEGICSSFPDYPLIQTWEYGEAKARLGPWKIKRMVLREAGSIVGAAQAFVRRLPLVKGGLVWINRPLLREQNAVGGAIVEAVLQAFRLRWVQESGMYLRVGLPLMEGEVSEETLRGQGFDCAGSRGWASARIDLAQDMESLRGRLRTNWRRHLNKAERLGLSVRASSDPAEMKSFLKGYRRFVRKKRFNTTLTPEFLDAMISLSADRRFLLLTGYKQERLLGSILIGCCERVCEFLASNLVVEEQSHNIGKLLMWQAVCETKSRGCRWFDVGGMDEERTTPGIFYFKDGIGGTPYRLAQEIEAFDGRWANRLVRWLVQYLR